MTGILLTLITAIVACGIGPVSDLVLSRRVRVPVRNSRDPEAIGFSTTSE
jgi:hypothetical protein